jgi:SHS2 domain-containing protein
MPSDDVNITIRGEGPTLSAAFAEAALAMTAVITDPAAVRLAEAVEIECMAPDAEHLLANWLNAVVHEMAARGMVFGAYQVDADGFQLRAIARGERLSGKRHAPAVEIKGATLAGLAVAEDRPGEWRAQCVVDIVRP